MNRYQGDPKAYVDAESPHWQSDGSDFGGKWLCNKLGLFCHESCSRRRTAATNLVIEIEEAKMAQTDLDLALIDDIQRVQRSNTLKSAMQDDCHRGRHDLVVMRYDNSSSAVDAGHLNDKGYRNDKVNAGVGGKVSGALWSVEAFGAGGHDKNQGHERSQGHVRGQGSQSVGTFMQCKNCGIIIR